MAPYKPLFAPTSERPSPGFGGVSAIIRDQFQATTLMLLGAALLGPLFLLTRSGLIVLFVYAVLLYKLLNALLMVYGYRKDASMEDVIPKKFTAQLPPVQGKEDVPASQGIVVFLLGARVNHPLGLLAPGAKELGDWAQKCFKEVEEKRDEYGLLGMSHFLGTDRAASNEILTLMYFRTTAGLHDFALSQVHRDTWTWFLAIQKRYPHIGIMHETYDVPARGWEAIYLQMHRTGLGAAEVKMTLEEREASGVEGGEAWWSTPVDATKGKMRSSRGRMDRSDGGENAKEGFREIY
ncbi:hypothetical protein CALCODRAFT_506971 [Calocera cornea HHB12733]|uniref:Uncharacterized protein n=1 Tax=Calocera cornea HHB12733 TaxID=1353952 RepID=A0A165IAN6_9BASI|nr:hypothetical protein CALCODRAFT_506971 [Calocera cornea HHB12733]